MERCIVRESRAGSVSERFFKRFAIDSDTGCWNWTGAKNAKGYGVIGGKIDGKRYAPAGQMMLAHRVSWILHFGEIPEGSGAHGMIVMHKCDNPGCVNPQHLRLGTQSENVLDMDRKGRRTTRALSGVEHGRAIIKDQAVIDLICSTQGKTKELAERFGVSVNVVKQIRQRNGLGSETPEKFRAKNLPQEVIDHIRSTPPGTRGLTKKYGLGKTAIANIRKGLTYK
jgi:hypothetical protein